MSRIGTSCSIFKNILGMHTEEDKALAIHDVMEMETHNGFTKAEMLNVIKWLWHQRYSFDEKPMTNADRIRNMTDEELAEFLGQIVYYCRGRQDNKWCKDCPLMTCRGCNNILIGEWLQAEVKEGSENG